jgi:hypothetical protein
MRNKDTEHECADCGAPIDLLGWVFTTPEGEEFSIDGLVKEERPYCKKHFIEHMFSLWPFTCTDECREAQSDHLGIELKPKHTWVWLDLRTVLVVDEDAKDDPLPGDVMKPRGPACPWCQKPMKLLRDKKKRAAG